ncbi:5-oxoprolinase subunit C family protein [Salinimicrobium xinjiangense]|uniref:5-oxoprolinase subunit C family protein n=1 Tax=Salinimicrobium xinjiangense TaxID=438596 RepID=UPI00040CE914|nr:biotin-dependent carboxyltransferase family protein [Salinimicrobium xinjiangense]
MKAEVEVLHPGLFSSIQDGGRFGYRKYGVPQSGPMDNAASALANLLLQQERDTAVMEITLQGPKLKFLCPTQIVITGASLSPRLDEEELRNNRVYSVSAGQVLSFGKRISGSRAYLSIKNGFKTEEVLRSLSWSPGITQFSRLEKGMKLPFLGVNEKSISSLSSVGELDHLASEIVEAFPGPEFHLLSTTEKNMLQKSHFSVGRNSNRMGIQFEEELKNNLEPIITAPVIPGTVQLTPSGKIIALMRDCQTTGGYPRILQLSEAGINVLAQKVPGEKIRIKLIKYLKEVN